MMCVDGKISNNDVIQYIRQCNISNLVTRICEREI
jgi:hypothetical protein